MFKKTPVKVKATDEYMNISELLVSSRYEEWRLLGCCAVWFIQESHGVTSQVLTRATRRNIPGFLQEAHGVTSQGSYKSHTV
jgi:hypothetical protein